MQGDITILKIFLLIILNLHINSILIVSTHRLQKSTLQLVEIFMIIDYTHSKKKG